MGNHDHNGHGEGHDDHATEGNRQFYPSGWHLPLVGLFVVAFGFALLGGWVLGMSGTDKWGKSHASEETHHGGAPALDQHHGEEMKPKQDPKQHDEDKPKVVDSAGSQSDSAHKAVDDHAAGHSANDGHGH